MNPENILFHQPSVDIRDSTFSMYSEAVPQPNILLPRNADEQLALDAFERVLELKQAVGSKDNASMDIAGYDISRIAAKRTGALLLHADLFDLAEVQNLSPSWYALGDVAEFTQSGARLDAVYKVEQEGRTGYIRMEEALVLKAESIVTALTKMGKSADGNYEVENGKFNVRAGGRAKKSVNLRGYEFNRNSNSPEDRVSLPNLPSCEVFIAATVLEQIELSDGVVRTIPYWMKDREMAARNMLRMLGLSELPVVSVFAGETGDVEKIVKWSSNLPDAIQKLLPNIRERTAHRVSSHAAKKIHDSVFAEHRRLYKDYCHPELDTNIAPSELLETDLVSVRAHEFLSRTLRAAPMLEQHKIGPDNADDTLAALNVLMSIFSLNYQNQPLAYPARPIKTHLMEGINTNRVLYVHGVLASGPEADPFATGARQIDLVVHALYENPSQELLSVARRSKNAQEVLGLYATDTPRYMLLEARRTGEYLERGKPHKV